MIVELQPHRRAAAGLGDGRQAVDVIGGCVGRAGAPHEVGPRWTVANAHRPIPRQALVPLHVAVEGEQLAGGAEGSVEVIAEARGHQAHVLAVVVQPPDGPAGGEDVGGVPAGVVQAR